MFASSRVNRYITLGFPRTRPLEFPLEFAAGWWRKSGSMSTRFYLETQVPARTVTDSYELRRHTSLMLCDTPPVIYNHILAPATTSLRGTSQKRKAKTKNPISTHKTFAVKYMWWFWWHTTQIKCFQIKASRHAGKHTHTAMTTWRLQIGSRQRAVFFNPKLKMKMISGCSLKLSKVPSKRITGISIKPSGFEVNSVFVYVTTSEQWFAGKYI